MVDANFSILEGDPSIIPSDEMLKISKNGKTDIYVLIIHTNR